MLRYIALGAISISLIGCSNVASDAIIHENEIGQAQQAILTTCALRATANQVRRIIYKNKDLDRADKIAKAVCAAIVPLLDS